MCSAAARTPCLEVHRRDDREAEPRVVDQVLGREQRSADADMRGAILEQQSLLPCPAERRAVRVRSAEVRVPRVEVRVEVQEGDRPVPPPHHAQERQRDRVVAPERQQRLRAAEQVLGRRLDLRDRLGEVERVARDVSRVGDLLLGERVHVEPRMVRAQEPRRCDRARAEPRPRPVRDPLSNGIPTTATSQRSTSSAAAVANVERPANRGTSSGSSGPTGPFSWLTRASAERRASDAGATSRSPVAG